MGSEAQRRPGFLNDGTGVGIGIFVLTFLEPLIHDSKYGEKRLNNNAICLLNLNKRAKLILQNLLVD